MTSSKGEPVSRWRFRLREQRRRLLGPKKGPLAARWWWLLFSGILVTHVIWELLNDAPPVWDMAHHQLMGFRILEALREEGLAEAFISVSGYYPPLYYLQEAFLLGVLGPTQFLALLANLPGLFLLGFFGCRIARTFLPSPAAEAAGILPLLLPMVAWTSRDSLLDVSLSGWVALFIYLLIRSEGLRRRGPSLLLGAVVAAGLLTKWSFAACVAAPLVFVFYRTPDRARAVRNLLEAALVAIPPVFLWYLPNLKVLISRLRLTAEAAIVENDPSFLEPAGWLYYLRVLAGYYFYLPLAVLFVWGAIRAWRSRGSRPRSQERQLLVCWFLGGVAVLTLLAPKDPRYLMPLVAPATILLVDFWRDSQRVVRAALVLAGLQFLSVSFPFQGSPFKLAIFEYEPATDYRTLGQEWVFYQSGYFDVAGPPRREDWGYAGLLKQLPPEARVGFLPELPRFNSSVLSLYAFRSGKRLSLQRLGLDVPSAGTLDSLQYVVGKTGRQGVPFLTRRNEEVYERLRGGKWNEVYRAPLPDGSRMRIWKRLPGADDSPAIGI